VFNIQNNINEIKNHKFRAKITYLMKKHNLNHGELIILIQNLNIYLDYDEVLVDLNKSWLKFYNKENNTNYHINDINKFYWWENKKNGLDFLNSEDMYNDVEKTEYADDLFKILQSNNLEKNVKIATFSYPKNILSKFNNIKRNFPNITEKQIYYIGEKWMLNYNHAILIDDSAEHAQEIVEKNPYAYVFLLDKIYNKNIKTGHRIKRITNILEFFDYLPLVVLEIYDIHKNKNINIIDLKINKD